MKNPYGYCAHPRVVDSNLLCGACKILHTKFFYFLLAFFCDLGYLIENESGFHIGRYHERRCSKGVFGAFFLCRKLREASQREAGGLKEVIPAGLQT